MSATVHIANNKKEMKEGVRQSEKKSLKEMNREELVALIRELTLENEELRAQIKQEHENPSVNEGQECCSDDIRGQLQALVERIDSLSASLGAGKENTL